MVINFMRVGEDDPQAYSLTDWVICSTVYVRNTEGESGIGHKIYVHFLSRLSQGCYKTFE